jgi:hypothetical protein
MLVGVGFFVVGSCFSVVFCRDLPVDLVISLSRASATGRVVSTQVDESVEVNGRNPTAVAFEFTAGQQSHQGTCSTMDDEVLAGLHVGGAAQVEYASLVPSWARLAGTTRSPFGYVVAFLLAFPLVGVLLVWTTWRENRREIRAFTWGRAIAARRVSFEEDRTTEMNGRHPWQLSWEFSLNVKTYTGALSSMNRDDLSMYAEAEQVPVLYLEETPEVNVLYVA